MDLLQKYLIAINIFSFGLFTVDYVRFIQSGKGLSPWWIFNVVTIIGGSAGAFLALTIWDRKVVKENITWRVFTVCMLIIHIVIYFSVYSVLNGDIKWKSFSDLITGVQNFVKTHRRLWYYLLAINLITFIAFAVDKVKAIKRQWRIRELTLLGLSLAGGTIGGLIAMYTMRHKINSPQFSFGMPMMVLAQVLLMGYWIARVI